MPLITRPYVMFKIYLERQGSSSYTQYKGIISVLRIVGLYLTTKKLSKIGGRPSSNLTEVTRSTSDDINPQKTATKIIPMKVLGHSK